MGLGATIAVASLVVLLSWASFWSALTANVGMSRGAPPGLGARWGFLLGPVGLAVVMARTRGGGRSFDERLTASKQLAGRYRTKAVRSAHAWRDPATGGAAGGAPGPGRPSHVQVPAPTWGPPPALGPPAVAPPAVPAPAVAPPAALPPATDPVTPVWGTPSGAPAAPVWGSPPSDPPAEGAAGSPQPF